MRECNVLLIQTAMSEALVEVPLPPNTVECDVCMNDECNDGESFSEEEAKIKLKRCSVCKNQFYCVSPNSSHRQSSISIFPVTKMSKEGLERAQVSLFTFERAHRRHLKQIGCSHRNHAND